MDLGALLRARGLRPRSRTGYERDELAPVHSTRSSILVAHYRQPIEWQPAFRYPSVNQRSVQGATAMTRSRRLRELLQRAGLLVAPGAYDCITARTIAQAGFEAVYMTGAGTAATLGYPDYGLLTMSEMADNAGRIAASVDVPVIADADTGYGNELNTTRTIREYERRGVAGLHIEDQGFPKKCGHLDNKVIVPLEEYAAKIRAAAAAKRDPDFLLIARTDARAV